MSQLINNTRVYKPDEFAKLINVSPRTLFRWEKAGTLNALRTPTGRRLYTHEQYIDYCKKLGLNVDEEPSDINRGDN